MERNADPLLPLSPSETLQRFEYMKSDNTSGMSLAVAIMVLGVVIHINLSAEPGIFIIFLGIAFAIMELFAGVLYVTNPKVNYDQFWRRRIRFFYIRQFLVLCTLACSMWAAIIMIQRFQSQ